MLSIETVDGNEEGQESSNQWTGGGEGRTWRLGPRDRGAGMDRGWLALGNIDEKVYMRRCV